MSQAVGTPPNITPPPSQHLVLGLPRQWQPGRNKCLLFKQPSLRHFVRADQTKSTRNSNTHTYAYTSTHTHTKRKRQWSQVVQDNMEAENEPRQYHGCLTIWHGEHLLDTKLPSPEDVSKARAMLTLQVELHVPVHYSCYSSLLRPAWSSGGTPALLSVNSDWAFYMTAL